MKPRLPNVVHVAQRDQGVVVANTGAFRHMMEFRSALAAAVSRADHAAQGGEKVSPVGAGVQKGMSSSMSSNLPAGSFFSTASPRARLMYFFFVPSFS